MPPSPASPSPSITAAGSRIRSPRTQTTDVIAASAAPAL